MIRKPQVWWCMELLGTLLPYTAARTRKDCIEVYNDAVAIQDWYEPGKKDRARPVKILVMKVE